MILEATCGKCEETFNPADTQDIIHIVKEDGSFCGGTGVIEGEYIWNQNPVAWVPTSDRIIPVMQRGRDTGDRDWSKG